MGITDIENFLGGLSLVNPRNVNDDQFEELTNMFYNKDKRIQTRRGVKFFGDELPNETPPTSTFFFQNDETAERILLVTSGTVMYSYNEGTEAYTEIKTGLQEFEADGFIKTRWSFAVYRNEVYMCNGRDAYQKLSSPYGSGDFSTPGLTSVGNCTFDNTTDLITLNAHGLVDGESVRFITSGTLPAEIESGKYYYVISSLTNTFQIADTPGGVAIDFTDDGTPTTVCSKVVQPRVRYLEYMQDSIFGAGDDANPSTLYYSDAGATNADDIAANVVVVGGDELGRINGIKELGEIILTGKNDKIYSINVATNVADPIDSQNGLYSNRAIKRVGGSLAYFNDTGYDFLKQRSGVTGSQGLESESKTNDLRLLIDQITPNSFNYSFSEYIGALTNLYWTFDTGDDKVPDTTLVWSTIVGAWSQYILPNAYDSAQYIDEDGVVHYLLASGTEGRIYEIETGFSDFDEAIPHSLTTKEWDFGDITRFKTFPYVDIIGLKSDGGDINVEILIDGEVVGASIIDNSYINVDSSVLTIGNRPIGSFVIGGGAGIEEVDLFQYKIRLPIYDTGNTIQIKMNSETAGLVWTLEKASISSDEESDDLFEYNLIG